MSGMPSCRMRAADMTRQTSPRACVTRKLIASGVTRAAAHASSASGGSTALSTTSTKPPARSCARHPVIASGAIDGTLPRWSARGKARRPADARLEHEVAPDPRHRWGLEPDRVCDAAEAERGDRRNTVAAEERRRKKEDEPIDDARAERRRRGRRAALDEHRREPPVAEGPDDRRERHPPAARADRDDVDPAPPEPRDAGGERVRRRDDPRRWAAAENVRPSRERERPARDDDP